jgi:DNA-binding LytR/AlgR family response regulator
MRIIIIEDEAPAANRLIKLIQSLRDDVEIVKRLDSVESSVNYFKTSPQADLIFMDIQLADGLSFQIFESVEIQTPIIFTTAFDQYTLKAFKVNSVDYLLKPIDEKELEKSLDKYQQLHQKNKEGFSNKILQLVEQINQTKFKERILIKRGQQMSFIKTEQLAYSYADGKLCFAVDLSGNKYLLECNLTQLEEQLAPKQFFRINRNLLVNIDSIQKVHTWLGGRLKLELVPTTNIETVVSRERVNEFKDWLGGN